EPANSVRILIVEREGEGQPVKSCVDFRGRREHRSSNPHTEDQVVFDVRDATGHRPPETTVETRGGASGLNCGHTLDASLPCAASDVDVTVSLFSGAATIAAYNQDGSFAG